MIKLSIIAAIIAVMVIGIVVCIKTQLFVDPVKSNPEGKYVVKTMDGKTVEETFKELAGDVDNDLILDILGIKSFDDFVTLELKTDGKVAFLALDEEPDEGTWKQDGDIVTITIDDEPAEFNFNGNELTGEFEEDGESHEYVFVKK